MSKDKFNEVGVKLELHLKVVKRCKVKQWLPNNKDFRFVDAWEKDIGDSFVMAKGSSSDKLCENINKDLLKDTIEKALEDLENGEQSELDQFSKKLDEIVDKINLQDN